jgi:hypothetical protein
MSAVSRRTATGYRVEARGRLLSDQGRVQPFGEIPLHFHCICSGTGIAEKPTVALTGRGFAGIAIAV